MKSIAIDSKQLKRCDNFMIKFYSAKVETPKCNRVLWFFFICHFRILKDLDLISDY